MIRPPGATGQTHKGCHYLVFLEGASPLCPATPPLFCGGALLPHTPCDAAHRLWVEGEKNHFWLNIVAICDGFSPANAGEL